MFSKFAIAANNKLRNHYANITLAYVAIYFAEQLV